MSFSNYVRAGLVGLALTMPLTGCGQSRLEAPKRSDLDKSPVYISNGLFVLDEDNDGEADLIVYYENAKYVAEGFQSKKFDTRYAEIMSKEMRNAASKELHAEKELKFLINRAEYERMSKFREGK